MKKLVKKAIKQENIVRPYCRCGCSCRPYEDATSERYDSNAYTATMSQG